MKSDTEKEIDLMGLPPRYDRPDRRVGVFCLLSFALGAGSVILASRVNPPAPSREVTEPVPVKVFVKSEPAQVKVIESERVIERALASPVILQPRIYVGSKAEKPVVGERSRAPDSGEALSSSACLAEPQGANDPEPLRAPSPHQAFKQTKYGVVGGVTLPEPGEVE